MVVFLSQMRCLFSLAAHISAATQVVVGTQKTSLTLPTGAGRGFEVMFPVSRSRSEWRLMVEEEVMTTGLSK